MFSDFVDLIPKSIPDPITDQRYLHSDFKRVQILSFPMRDQYYTYHGSVVGIVFDTKKRTPFTHTHTHTHTHQTHPS